MNLIRRQELFLDGIETSLLMIRISYSRLHHDISQFIQFGNQRNSPFDFQNQILLDAWSLVDTINRLRILVSQIPGVKKNSAVELLLNATERIVILRNFVQHINSEIPKIEDSGWPVWGSLSWIYISPEIQNQKEIKIMAIVPGRLSKSKGYPLVNPCGKEIKPPIDHISLTVANTIIDLSDVFYSIIKFGKRFEIALTRARQNRENNSEKNDIMHIVLDE